VRKQPFVVASCLAVAILVLGANTAIIDDAVVDAYIRAGQTKQTNRFIASMLLPGNAESPDGDYYVVLSGNAGRIALLAQEATRLYKPFRPADVSGTLRTPQVFVQAVPRGPAAPLEHIVLKSKVDTSVVQSETFETEVVPWTNKLGGEFLGNAAVATFSLASVRPLLANDFDVVLITAKGERRGTVGKDDRARVFPNQ